MGFLVNPTTIDLDNLKIQNLFDPPKAKYSRKLFGLKFRRGGDSLIFGRRGCADYMGGFFLGAKYVDMGIFWNLYLWV